MFSLEIQREILNRRPNSNFFSIAIWNRRSCCLSACLPTDRKYSLSLRRPTRHGPAVAFQDLSGSGTPDSWSTQVEPSAQVSWRQWWSEKSNGSVLLSLCKSSSLPCVHPHYPFHKLFAAALSKASSSLSEKSHPAAWKPLKIMPHPEFPPDRSKCLFLRASKQNLFHSNLSRSDPLLSHYALILEAPQVLSSAQPLVGHGRLWQHFASLRINRISEVIRDWPLQVYAVWKRTFYR